MLRLPLFVLNTSHSLANILARFWPYAKLYCTSRVFGLSIVSVVGVWDFVTVTISMTTTTTTTIERMTMTYTIPVLHVFRLWPFVVLWHSCIKKIHRVSLSLSRSRYGRRNILSIQTLWWRWPFDLFVSLISVLAHLEILPNISCDQSHSKKFQTSLKPIA